MASPNSKGIILNLLSNSSATVVNGPYPEQLLTCWDTYKASYNSENERPSTFLVTQKYCVMQLSHHGQDLESYSISTWSEAAHIFWSAASILARGEESAEFEHRDLHWGNILIDRSEEDDALERLLENLSLESDADTVLDKSWKGVKVTLIDYTLSRATVDDVMGKVAFYGFDDENLFEGKRYSGSMQC